MATCVASERRGVARERLAGSAVVHAPDRTIRGRVMDLTPRSLRIRCERTHRLRDLLGSRVELEVRLDGAIGGWVRYAGTATHLRGRADLVVIVDVASSQLDELVDHLLGELRAYRHLVDVLVVDARSSRRTATAEAFRGSGCRVIEAGTPYGAISVLEGASPALIAVADTQPARSGNELRRFLCAIHPASRVIATGDSSTSRTRRTWLCTADHDRSLSSRVRELVTRTGEPSKP